MSSEPPPNPITSTFNLRAWIQAVGSGLSLATASTYFLSKRLADTAAGVITFSSGIKTNLIDGAGTASTQVKIFPNSTDAIIDIGPQFGYVGQSSLIRFGPGGNCDVAMGQIGNTLTAQTIDSFSSGTPSLFNTKTLPINIGSSSTAIRLGASQANTNTVTIGNTGSIISIPGATTLGAILCAAINSTAAGTTMNIASTSTGIVTLATSASRTGVLNLGDGASSTGAVHVNNGASSSGNTRIMNGSGQSGELTLGGSNTVVIAVNRPMTVGYTTTALTSFNQIGYTQTTTVTFSRTFNSTFTAFSPYATQLPVGVYMISYWVYIQTATAGGEVKSDLIGSTSVITAGATTGFTSCGDGGFPPSKYVLFNRQPIPYAGEFERNVSGTVYVTTNTYLAVGVSSTTTFTTGGVELQITRIA